MEETATASSSSEPQPIHLETLKKYFDLSSFRPKQWDIIRSIIVNHKDNCVVMATGYGKSLLYQYPSVFLKGVTFVISPLISLMQDQVWSLKERNIASTYLESGQHYYQNEDIVACKYQIVYLSAEYAMSVEGIKLLEDVSDKLNLIAIDEAHCLSEWGHDFRPNYRKLADLRKNEKLVNVPILALSAVATKRVREDIVDTLGLQEATIWCTGFDRPNLNFRVKKKGSDIWEDVKELLNRNSGSSIIIYCLTKKLTEENAKLLKEKGIGCEVYHAKSKKRSEVQQNFMDNHVKIIVCTVAFGTGLDKPDVRLVIHYGVPMEFETYYIQVGQAGRDGIQSQCVMYWNKEDFEMHYKIRNLDKIQTNPKILKIHERQSEMLRNYIDTKDCRRKFILRYFEDNSPRCCDNCESILEANSSQTNPTETQHEEDIQPENPSPAKQPKLAPA